MTDEEESKRRRYVSGLAAQAVRLREAREFRCELDRLSWWDFGSRAELRRQVREKEAEQQRLARPLDRETQEDIAARLIRGAVTVRRREISYRNAFHPEVLAALDDLVAEVRERLERASFTAIDPRHFYGDPRNVLALELPGLAELLTPEAIRAHVIERVEELRVIAADDGMLIRTGNGSCLVEHRATGLSLSFTEQEERPGLGHFGAINAKSFPPQWEDFVGLGIGTKLYRRGAAELPGVRWRETAPKAAAVGARGHLHPEDPYAWHWSDCQWCSDQGGWAQLPRSAFVDHP